MTLYQQEMLRKLGRLDCAGRYDEEKGLLVISSGGTGLCCQDKKGYAIRPVISQKEGLPLPKSAWRLDNTRIWRKRRIRRPASIGGWKLSLPACSRFGENMGTT